MFRHDQAITLVKKLGRHQWKQASGYHRQGRVENTFFRYKSILGEGLVLAPFAVDQAACLRADGEQRVDSSASSDSVGWTVTDTCTTATKIRRVRPPAVKMSRNAKRWLTRPAYIAGVLVSRPNLNARCGRMKL